MAYPSTTGYQWQPGDNSYVTKPAPSPKGSFTYDTINPNVQSFTGMQKLNPNDYPSGQNYGPGNSNIGEAIKTYESMITPARPHQSVSISSPVPQSGESDTWRNRIYDERAANQAADERQSAAQAPAPRAIQPMQAIDAPDLPKYKAQEYKPPEEDKSLYRKYRQEALSPAMRELREGTREAIVTAQSLDNPNARGKFIQDAIKGYGQGLEKASMAASREGRQLAMDKRHEQLDIYKTNYSAQSNAFLTNYQNKVNNIAQDFAQKQATAMTNFNAQMNPNVVMSGGGSIPASGINISAGYGNKPGAGINSPLYQKYYGVKS